MSTWICVMSLVQRVMREAVENFTISALEKEVTFRKASARRSRPTLEETRAAMRLMRMENTIISTLSASILNPTLHR